MGYLIWIINDIEVSLLAPETTSTLPSRVLKKLIRLYAFFYIYFLMRIPSAQLTYSPHNPVALLYKYSTVT